MIFYIAEVYAKVWIKSTDIGTSWLQSFRQSQQLLKYDIAHLSTAVSEHIIAFFINCVFYTRGPITRGSKFSKNTIM